MTFYKKRNKSLLFCNSKDIEYRLEYDIFYNNHLVFNLKYKTSDKKINLYEPYEILLDGDDYLWIYTLNSTTMIKSVKNNEIITFFFKSLYNLLKINIIYVATFDINFKLYKKLGNWSITFKIYLWI